MEYSHEIRVPKDRLAVLIGTKGVVKRKLEGKTGVKLTIDSAESIVYIGGTDALGVFVAREVVRAIARGFSPEVAVKLLQFDMVFEVVSIADFIKHKEHLERVRGRIIGTEGKTRAYIEEVTETDISVYGKTVGIIGKSEYVTVARKAIETLLLGSPHANVYRWLEKQRKLVKRREHEEDAADFAPEAVKKDFKDISAMR